MPASDTTTVAFIYKRRYSDRQATFLAMREHPTYFAITKEGDFTGEGLYYPITYGNPQGIGGTLVAAKSGAETLKGVQMRAVPVLRYGVIELDGPSMLRAKGNKAAMFDLVTRTTDATIEEFGSDLAFNLQRSTTGLRGQRTAIAANVITLANKRQVDRFKVGMTIMASPNANGTAPRAGTAKVTKLNRQAAQIEVDNAGGITAFANNDFLFRNGDAPGLCFEGMGSCTPLVAPTAGDNFRTIDRSVDVELLSGSRFVDTSLFPEDAVGNLAVEISTITKKVTRAAMYPTDFHGIVKRLGAKVEYENPGGHADIGFESITITTAAGPVKVMSDPDAEPGQTRVWRPDTHVIKHCDELVHIIRDDGKPAMRMATDGIEIRLRSLSNYIQYDTGPHGVCQHQLAA